MHTPTTLTAELNRRQEPRRPHLAVYSFVAQMKW